MSEDHYKTPRALPAAWQTSGEEGGLSWFQKALMVMGAIFGVLIIVGVIGVSVFAYFNVGQNREARAYADAAIPAIITAWQPEELEKRLSPEARATLKPGELARLFATYVKLGKFKQYKGAQGQAQMGYVPGKGRVVSGFYVGMADFEKGPARIRLQLIRDDAGQWQIMGFWVDSPALIQ
jgi:hypothetical protein